MRIFFDTEFLDHGNTVELLSLGAVRDDGEEFYMENAECDLYRANNWVQKHVIPHLTGPTRTPEHIRAEFQAFCGYRPEFWAYYGTYDWWLVCQLFGGFMNLPGQWPRYFNEIMTLPILTGRHLYPAQTGIEHHALHDARWNRSTHDYFLEYLA